jgi:hypothetical protein
MGYYNLGFHEMVTNFVKMLLMAEVQLSLVGLLAVTFKLYKERTSNSSDFSLVL